MDQGQGGPVGGLNTQGTTAQLTVDQQRNQVLATISQFLGTLVGVGGGVTTVSGVSSYAVKNTDRLIGVDASAGNVKVIYAPTLMVGVLVGVYKFDSSSNSVIISPDGTATAASFNTPISGSVVDSRTVWSNGTALRVATGI